MNFIFGVIILAIFILALRVIWATGMQLLATLKSGMATVNHHLAQRAANRRVPVIMPQIRHEVDWDVMADTVRKEIQLRNSGFSRDTTRLEAQLQAKLKTIEIYEADIQIAKLERELTKIRPVVEAAEPEIKKRRRKKNQTGMVTDDQVASKSSSPVYQLREALKGNG